MKGSGQGTDAFTGGWRYRGFVEVAKDCRNKLLKGDEGSFGGSLNIGERCGVRDQHTVDLEELI